MVGFFEMMDEFEGVAGRLSARRMTDDERRVLKEQHKACEPYARRGDRDNYQIMNNAFHVTLYKGSHNHYLIAHATALYDSLAPYRLSELNRPGQVIRPSEEHTRIFEGLRERNGEWAYRMLHQAK